ncbi:glycosyltransferase family 2 protein [bacterium]
MNYKNKLAVIIPTKNRNKDLLRLLKSIEIQSYLPDQLIIVDSSFKPCEEYILNAGSLNISYKHVNLSSLTKSRNIGINMLEDKITHVCFLDDDIVLEKGALEAMMSFWDTAEKYTGGCSFNIIDANITSSLYVLFFKSIFFMETFKAGKVLKSGFNNPYCPAKKTHSTQWLAGGATVWIRQVIDEYSYDEWFEGYGFCEDVDFSYRAGKKYKLFVSAEANIRHLMDKNKKRNNIVLGKNQIINRFYVVRKHSELSSLLCLWANIGQCVHHLLKGILKLNFNFILRSVGNFIGLFSFCLKREL